MHDIKRLLTTCNDFKKHLIDKDGFHEFFPFFHVDIRNSFPYSGCFTGEDVTRIDKTKESALHIRPEINLYRTFC